ncbi:YjfB family protein [Tissierella sp. MB52-C2]|uniref:YjfB family protein n=1 Tax=Tissierella sp. MB52-C2 TaxID=3070999 RepID=UPI00280A5FE8|nr:YjfB family protein [Tissierella sp. MB52-C2]WMM24180.1 YjfB family protein [Tissierella sp. MB52-C2]
MDIAALSIGLSQMKVAQEVGISVLKMAMDTSEIQVAEMLEVNTKAMEQSVNPKLGGNIDIRL